MTVYITDSDALEKLARVEEPYDRQGAALAAALDEARLMHLDPYASGENVVYGCGGWNRYLVERGTGRMLFISLMRLSAADEERARAVGFDVL